MMFPGRTPFKNQFQFFQPATQLSPDFDSMGINPNTYYAAANPEMNFSPHHMLYSQIKAVSSLFKNTFIWVLKIVEFKNRLPNDEFCAKVRIH